MGLDEDAGFAFVGFAEVVAGGDGVGDLGFEIGGLGDSFAVAAYAAVVGEAICLDWMEAVDEADVHQREGIFACAARSGEDDCLGDAVVLDGFAQPFDGAGIT